MPIQHANTTDFNEKVLNSPKTTLVDFYAEWCGPCKRISVVLEEIAQKNPSVEIVKVDVDANPEIAQNYNISSIPTLMLFKNGVPADQVVGAVSKAELEKLLSH